LLFEPDPSEVTTDKNGRYEIILKLSRENREYIIGIDPMSKTDLPQTGYIAASDVGRNLVALHEFERIPTHLDINLQPGITLSGSVKDTNGAPVTNAAVDFRFWLNLRLPRWTAQPVKVNAQGCFSFPDMPQGRDYYVYQVAAKGYGTTSTEVKVALTQTNHYEFSPVVLEPADRKLAGHVLGLDGKPVARATVRFDGSGQPGYPGYGAEVETDRQGHFAFDAVCEGPVTVSVNLNDLEGSAHAHGGDTNVVVKLALQDGVPAASRVDPGPIPANQPSPTSQP
jgi:protocatechuate 3,4-dioxygenase beta subunit